MARRWSTFFVTGGASGIGLGLATRLAAEGTAVAVFDRARPDAAVRALDAARRDGRPVAWFEVDVTDADGLDAAIEEASETIGPPALAVNSAGISRNERFAESTRAAFEDTVRVNLFGSRNFAAAVLPRMASGARLGLIASLAGLTGGYTYAAYTASKAGVIGLAKVLRLEYAPEGIGVSVLCPPEIVTPMVEQYATTMHPVTRALKDVAGTLPLDRACDEMLAGLARGRSLVIPGRRARRAARLVRYLPPRISDAIADRIVRRAIS